MKKRLISLLLAFSMMLTFLPAGAVSAFAEENTIDPEKGVLLKSGDTINDKFIEDHDGATTYQMRNNYASGVTISASEKVTINITGNIDYNGTLFNVLNSGNVMVENNKNYTVKGGARVVSLVQGTITVDGGTYYGSGTETFLNFRHNQGVMWLNDINVIASRDNAVNNQGGEVHIKGGTYTSNSSPVIYNQTWDRDAGGAELVGIMTLTDVTVESTSSGTGTGVGNSGNLTITGGKVTAPGPALNTYPKGETTVESGDFSSTGDCAVRVYGKLYLKGGTFTAPNGSAIQSRDDSAYTEISGGTIKDSKVGVEVVKGSVDLKKTTFQGNDIDIYLQEDQVITIESSFKNAATIDCADPKDGRQLTTSTTGTDYQKNLNLTSANKGYLVDYKKTTDGKEYRCLSKKVGVTISGLKSEIKAEDPAEFTVTLTHENSTGTGTLTFGDKNSEIEYKDEHGAYQPMPKDGLPINLASDKNDYAFHITPQKAGDQKLTAAVVRDAVEVGTDSKDYTVAGRVHTTVTIEGLENAVIKEGESKDFTVKVTPNDDANLGEAFIDFGDKNSEIEYKDENGEYKLMPEGGLKINLGDGEVERKFRIAPKETGKQTLTAAVKQDKNELARDEKDFVVSEMPILTLKDGVITSVTVPGKDGADPEDITEIVKKNANEDGSFNVPEGATVSVAFDKDAFADSGLKFGHWDITGLDDPNAYQDKESFAFVMPAKGVTLKAMTQDASIEDDEPDIVGPIVIGTTVVVGGAVLGYQAYSLGAEFAGKLMALPYFPSNRSALAMMLWEDAGKPMPESELLYPDVGQEERDMDLQHAARWAMENELIPDLNDEGTAPEEMKFYPDNTVSKIDVLNAWQKAQELKQNA
jgi:small nuclear ribonucleoprotein (snRNP)-like protein